MARRDHDVTLMTIHPNERLRSIIALIDNADVVERILRHLSLWDSPPETFHCAGPDPPAPKGETLPLTYHPLRESA
jgi:hypothetical protein